MFLIIWYPFQWTKLSISTQYEHRACHFNSCIIIAISIWLWSLKFVSSMTPMKSNICSRQVKTTTASKDGELVLEHLLRSAIFKSIIFSYLHLIYIVFFNNAFVFVRHLLYDCLYLILARNQTKSFVHPYLLVERAVLHFIPRPILSK